LGGGQGSRLYPLTDTRSKPAVPIAGKYRLVDIPISNCLNSGIERIFVLTQFNSASLNKHIKNTYHFSFFSDAFVDILAAEQTPNNSTWYQGTADAVRQCLNHLIQHECEYVLILSGDQLYQMNFPILIFVLTQFNSASLNKHIKNTYHFSFFSDAFVDILAAEQTPNNSTWYQGTADAVRQCLNHLVQHECEYVLILSGDQLYQMNF